MSSLLPVLALLLLVGPAAGRVEARTLRDALPDATRQAGIDGGSAFDSLSEALGDAAARAVPVVAASAGYTYRYNPQLEVFERTSETLGPIFVERPDTLGRGKLNVNVSFQYVQLDEIDGDDMGDLQSSDPIITRVSDVSGTLGFSAQNARYNLQLQNYVTAVSVTYGVLDDLDVNLLVPLISTNFDVGTTWQQVATAGPDGVFSPAPGPARGGSAHEVKVGIGDLLLRGKYQLPRLAWLRSAAGLELRLPSGDEDNFQGTGTFEATPSLYASTMLWNRVEPHAGIGVDLRADDVSQSEGRYAVGVDVDITRRIGFALAFLGRSQFEGSASESETSFQHLTPSGPQSQPLLGIDFDQKNFFDLSFGVRAVVWRQVMLFANGIYALNDDGLRSSEIIPTVGAEATF